jgi:hypothetical protein
MYLLCEGVDNAWRRHTSHATILRAVLNLWCAHFGMVDVDLLLLLQSQNNTKSLITQAFPTRDSYTGSSITVENYTT